LPSSIPANINLEYLLRNIPFNIQNAMNKHLGTSKLGPVILEKINNDELGKSITKSDIENYLSVALYSDIEGKDYSKQLKSLVKRVKNNIVRDYLFYKITYYYYRRTKPGSSKEAVYLDLLAELRIRSQKLPKRMKERVIKNLEDGKKRFLGKKI
jgi:hypothetical protein